MIDGVIAEADRLPAKQREVATELSRWLKEALAGNNPFEKPSRGKRKQKLPADMREQALLYFAFTLGVATSELRKQFLNDLSDSGRAVLRARSDLLGKAIDERLRKLLADNEHRRGDLPFSANEIAGHILADVNESLKSLKFEPVKQDTIRRRLRKKKSDGEVTFEVALN